ncbi:hypothetical protein BU26DRAFT_349567 [Trematosphaeria pertusa]|uniref:Uncharacterized protein n=1 Tax=Trematosphaeria pertusa TaxID=390896 RepID=A0A6A6IAW8_9PLEO|nr:uncharacterized protein BU26DRAFT_349567 [Trematosphaeria pertusa]KAF2247556.1 hypothetical protein BU26DRAFT_349567 [Trematosphaeria pertusa]
MTSPFPTPQTWTLRLKSRKTTVLLYTDPLHTFATIKAHLYTALQETGLRDPDTGENIPLPASPSDIQFGRPVDVNNAEKGFQLGEWEYDALLLEDEDDNGGKGKGKAKAKAGRPRKSEPGTGTVGAENVRDCPKGAGLHNGSVLAFRWRGDGREEQGEEEDFEMVGGAVDKPDMWDVTLASFEDSYGVENEIDVGGGREFEE